MTREIFFALLCFIFIVLPLAILFAVSLCRCAKQGDKELKRLSEEQYRKLFNTRPPR